MNQDLPSPEDSELDIQSSKTLRQLRRLQPRPAAIDADAIIQAAQELDQRDAFLTD